MVSIVGFTTNIETNALSDDNTVARPTGTADGNLMLTAVGLDGNDSTLTVPSGFTSGFALTEATTSMVTAYKLSASSEPATYFWSGWNNEPSAAAMLAIEDHDGIDASSSNTSDALTINLSTTTTVANCLLVVFLNSEIGGATWSAPDGTWTKLFDIGANTGATGSGLACFTKTQASAGATGTLTFTCSSANDNCAAIYAIAPLPAPSGSVGSAAGSSTAAAVSKPVKKAVGAAVASAVGSAVGTTAGAIGVAAGSSTVAAAGKANHNSVGTTAGTSTASGIKEGGEVAVAINYDEVTTATGLIWLNGQVDGVTKDGSNLVSAVTNRFTNVVTKFDSASTRRPLWVDSQYNGRACLRLDGGDDLTAEAAQSTNLTEETLFLVAKVTSSPAANTSRYLVGNHSGYDYGIFHRANTAGTEIYTEARFGGSTNNVNAQRDRFATWPIIDKVVITSLRRSASTGMLYQYENGVQICAVPHTGPTAFAPRYQLFGSVYGNRSSGDIIEFAAYSGMMSEAEHAGVIRGIRERLDLWDFSAEIDELHQAIQRWAKANNIGSIGSLLQRLFFLLVGESNMVGWANYDEFAAEYQGTIPDVKIYAPTTSTFVDLHVPNTNLGNAIGTAPTQNDVEGAGVEAVYLRTVQEHFDEEIYAFKFAVNGLRAGDQFDPDTSANQWVAFQAALDRAFVRAGLSGVYLDTKALNYDQGINDGVETFADAYLLQQRYIFEKIRETVDRPELLILNYQVQTESGSYPEIAKIKAAKVEESEEDANVILVPQGASFMVDTHKDAAAHTTAGLFAAAATVERLDPPTGVVASSAGSATTSGVARAAVKAVSLSSGGGSVAGVATAAVYAVGQAAGTATLNTGGGSRASATAAGGGFVAVAASALALFSGSFSASGQATTAAEGRALASSVFSATATNESLAESMAAFSAASASSGTATTEATGAAATQAVAASSGAATSAAVSIVTAQVVAAGAGTATTSGYTGQSTASTAEAEGSAASAVVGRAAFAGIAHSDGVATVEATSALAFSSVASGAGQTTVSGVGAAEFTAVAAGSGSATADAEAATQVAAVANASGTSLVLAAASGSNFSRADSAGTTTAVAAAVTTKESIAASSGTANVLGYSVSGSAAQSSGTSSVAGAITSGILAAAQSSGSSEGQATGTAHLLSVGMVSGAATAIGYAEALKQAIGLSGGGSSAAAQQASTGVIPVEQLLITYEITMLSNHTVVDLLSNHIEVTIL